VYKNINIEIIYYYKSALKKNIPIIAILVEKFQSTSVSLVIDWFWCLDITIFLLCCHILFLIYVLGLVIVVGIWIRVIVIGLSKDSVVLFSWSVAIFPVVIKVLILRFYYRDLCRVKKTRVILYVASIWIFLELFFLLVILSLYGHLVTIR
jgi:hypothetical protein